MIPLSFPWPLPHLFSFPFPISYLSQQSLKSLWISFPYLLQTPATGTATTATADNTVPDKCSEELDDHEDDAPERC